jgi:hypothetical protein
MNANLDISSHTLAKEWVMKDCLRRTFQEDYRVKKWNREITT